MGVTEYYTLKYPRGKAPKLHQLQKPMASLRRFLADACRRYCYTGAWLLLYENGREAGHHFHIAIAGTPSEALKTAVQRYWLKHSGEPSNFRNVFHASGLVVDQERACAYLAKAQKAGFVTKATQGFLINLKDRFKPFSWHGGTDDGAISKPEGSAAGLTKKVTPGKLSECDFRSPKVTFPTPGNPYRIKDQQLQGQGGEGGAAELLHDRQRIGMNNRVFLNGSTSSEPGIPGIGEKGVAIRVRFVCNHGRDHLVIPDSRAMTAHYRRIMDAGFISLGVPDADPLISHYCVMELSFSVPVGRIVEFERLVGSYVHARVFRSN